MRLTINSTQIKNVVQTLVLLAGFFFGILVSYNAMNLSDRIEYKTIVILAFSVLLFLIGGKIFKLGKSHLYNVFIVFCLMTSFGSFVRGDYINVCIPLIAIIALYLYRSYVYSITIKQLYMVYIAMILACGIAVVRYAVAAYNSQGVIIAFAGVALLNILCLRENNNIVLYVGLGILITVMLSLTTSRTSMLAFLIVYAISYYYIFMKKFTIKNSLVFIFTIIVLVNLRNSLEKFFYRIFFMKWANIDLTSNRIDIWRNVFSNQSLFGHGVHHIQGDAHNSFVQMLGAYGWISLIFFLIVLIMVGVVISKSRNKIIFINFFSMWVIISMFENLDILSTRLIPATVMFYIHIAILCNEESSGEGQKVSLR